VRHDGAIKQMTRPKTVGQRRASKIVTDDSKFSVRKPWDFQNVEKLDTALNRVEGEATNFVRI
jgi:hypothetical protein